MVCSQVFRPGVGVWRVVRLEVVCVALFALTAQSAAVAREPSPEVDRCLRLAADKYQLSYPLLRAIAEQESGFNPASLNAANRDGSADHGLMQINGSWLPTLSRYGITREDLYKPCVSADVGAWILHGNIKQLGLTWNAVGAYNAKTDWKRVQYAHGVYRKLMAQQGRAAPVTAAPVVSAPAPANTPIATATTIAASTPSTVLALTDRTAPVVGSMVVWERAVPVVTVTVPIVPAVAPAFLAPQTEEGAP